MSNQNVAETKGAAETKIVLPEITDDILAEARDFVLRVDRMRFEPFFRLIEEWCIDNGAILGGQVGLKLLLREPLDESVLKTWDIYVDNPYEAASNLGDLILDSFLDSDVDDDLRHLAKLVTIRSDIYSEFTINLEARSLFRIVLMRRYRDIPLGDVMLPTLRPSYFSGKKIKCIAEEIQLIGIYRNLYSASKAKTWREELENEDKLFRRIEKVLQKKALKVLALPSASPVSENAEVVIEGGAEQREFPWARYLPKIMRSRNGTASRRILIGDYALAEMGIVTAPERLQIITDEHIKDLVADFAEIIRLRHGHQLVYSTFAQNIPDDFQISKATIYIQTPNKKYPIADIFNSTQYEMIPFWLPSGTWRCGTPWVLMRFLFIDLWVLRLILNLNPNEAVKNRITTLFEKAQRLRAERPTAADDNFEEGFFHYDGHLGIYVNEKVARKQFTKKTRIYYPYKRRLKQQEESDELENGDETKDDESKDDESKDDETKDDESKEVSGAREPANPADEGVYLPYLRRNVDSYAAVGRPLRVAARQTRVFADLRNLSRSSQQTEYDIISVDNDVGRDESAVRSPYFISLLDTLRANGILIVSGLTEEDRDAIIAHGLRELGFSKRDSKNKTGVYLFDLKI